MKNSILTVPLHQGLSKKRMDRCGGFSVTFSTTWWLLRRRSSTIRSLFSRPQEKAMNASKLSVGYLRWRARELPLTEWQFCEVPLRLVRFASLRSLFACGGHQGAA